MLNSTTSLWPSWWRTSIKALLLSDQWLPITLTKIIELEPSLMQQLLQDLEQSIQKRSVSLQVSKINWKAQVALNSWETTLNTWVPNNYKAKPSTWRLIVPSTTAMVYKGLIQRLRQLSTWLQLQEIAKDHLSLLEIVKIARLNRRQASQAISDRARVTNRLKAQ